MGQLNQTVAVEKGLKARTATAVTGIYHSLQKAALFAGFTKVYQPKDEEGDRLPPERQLVQQNVEDLLQQASARLTDLFDVVLTKDAANMVAKADVVVDGQTLLTDAPVPYLLFLEKQLLDWRTVVSKLPVTDPSEVWTYDEGTMLYRTEPTQTTRTRKVPRVLEKAPATERHAAQTEVYMVDEVVGTWTNTRLSGAIQETRRIELVDRVNKLLDAVKIAVERANRHEVTQLHAGETIFSYLLRPSSR